MKDQWKQLFFTNINKTRKLLAGQTKKDRKNKRHKKHRSQRRYYNR
jgi:hypothetical protein